MMGWWMYVAIGVSVSIAFIGGIYIGYDLGVDRGQYLAHRDRIRHK